jgi:hypothetical protein
VTLKAVESRLVATVPALNEPAGRYTVWAGLVLMACSEAYMEASYEDGAGDEDVPIGLRERCMRGQRTAPTDELVVLSQVLSDPLTRGYTELVDRVVITLNGMPVHNLAQVERTLAAIDHKTHPYVRIDLDGCDVIVLDTRQALLAHPAILERNRIPPSLSPSPPSPPQIPTSQQPTPVPTPNPTLTPAIPTPTPVSTPRPIDTPTLSIDPPAPADMVL